MRRSFSRRPRGIPGRRLTIWIVPSILVLAILWYITAVTSFLQRSTASAGDGRVGKEVPCVAWRTTRSSTPYGVRDSPGDRDCQARISQISGYCECDNNLTTKRMECGGYMPFTCEQACGRLSNDMIDAEEFPANVACPRNGNHESSLLGAAAEWLHTYRSSSHHNIRISTLAQPSSKEYDAQATRLWGLIREALEVVGEDTIRLPERRTVHVDWVRDGVRIPLDDINAAKNQWLKFMTDAPDYPMTSFHGKGIVILAGGLTYMVPAWVNIHMLRRTGCNLPVEMFFPRKEYPTPAMESALSDLGVICRQLPDLQPSQEPPVTEQAVSDPQAGLSGFTMKIAALILSQFREVIFMDSDNVAVADPSELFRADEYLATGALLWPDYWQSSAAPDLAKILGVEQLPKGTFESGQMVFDKQRVWQGLLLAAFFNMESELYYELFSNYMGKGDKESFAHALQAMHLPYNVVRHPVGTVGEIRRHCQPSGSCEVLFLGNTMTQYAPDGRPMFLHTNLSPKWNLEIPGNFSFYRRRWKTVVPGGGDFMEQFGDLEWEVYRILVALRCAPFLPSYVQALSTEDRMGEDTGLSMGLKGFHAYNPGVEFRQAYRWGLSGPYLSFTKVSISDRLSNFANTFLRSRLGFCWRMYYRATSPFRKKDPYFTIW